MRNNKFLIFILFFAFLFGQACQNENPLITPESENAKTLSIDKSNIVPGDLTPEETDGLIHMRLDEKLARDVYIYLGELYNQKIFLSIQESEQKHMDAINNLLDKYLVEDPLESDVIGVFPEDFPEFQELYDLYVSKGETSVQEAIAVGIAIEELDIADLEALRLITDNPDILKVYDKLLAASQIHLSKFLMHVKTEITIELTNVALEDLSEEETLGLVKMRFNEKLARDVYIFIGNLYNQNIFLNIQESEQNHINAILELFTKYLIEDPIIVDEVGVFPVLDFQELYDSYISESESSTQEAIEVGLAIEELIIADLEYLLTITDNTDILKIYEKLLDSSKNHLLQLLNHVKPEIVNNSFYMKRSIDQKSNSNTNVNSKKRSKR